VFEDEKSILGSIQGPDDAREYSKSVENVNVLEERLKNWMKKVHEVLELSFL